MGQINIIKGDKKTKKQPNKYMVSVTFDLYAADNEEACYKLADYLQCYLTNHNPWGKDGYKKPYPRVWFESSKLTGKYDVENGVDILV